MASSQNVKKHHKTKVKNCKGYISNRILLKPDDYVYWCPDAKKWLDVKCKCSDAYWNNHLTKNKRK